MQLRLPLPAATAPPLLTSLQFPLLLELEFILVPSFVSTLLLLDSTLGLLLIPCRTAVGDHETFLSTCLRHSQTVVSLCDPPVDPLLRYSILTDDTDHVIVYKTKKKQIINDESNDPCCSHVSTKNYILFVNKSLCFESTQNENVVFATKSLCNTNTKSTHFSL